MNSTQMKEQMITEYIKNIDFISQNFSMSQIKQDLRQILQETPGVEVAYNKEKVIVEDKATGEKKEQREAKVKSITFAFSDGEQTMDIGNGQTTSIPRMHKFTLYI